MAVTEQTMERQQPTVAVKEQVAGSEGGAEKREVRPGDEPIVAADLIEGWEESIAEGDGTNALESIASEKAIERQVTNDQESELPSGAEIVEAVEQELNPEQQLQHDSAGALQELINGMDPSDPERGAYQKMQQSIVEGSVPESFVPHIQKQFTQAAEQTRAEVRNLQVEREQQVRILLDEGLKGDDVEDSAITAVARNERSNRLDEIKAEYDQKIYGLEDEALKFEELAENAGQLTEIEGPMAIEDTQEEEEGTEEIGAVDTVAGKSDAVESAEDEVTAGTDAETENVVGSDENEGRPEQSLEALIGEQLEKMSIEQLKAERVAVNEVIDSAESALEQMQPQLEVAQQVIQSYEDIVGHYDALIANADENSKSGLESARSEAQSQLLVAQEREQAIQEIIEGIQTIVDVSEQYRDAIDQEISERNEAQNDAGVELPPAIFALIEQNSKLKESLADQMESKTAEQKKKLTMSEWLDLLFQDLVK